MSLKINILPIIRDHINTLYHAQTKSKALDVSLFIGIPLIMALLSSWFCPIIKDDLLSIIATVFTIFTALLLSLLLLLYDMSGKIKYSTTKKAFDLLVETKANISFLIVSSIISLFVIIALSIVSESVLETFFIISIDTIKKILSFISYFLLGIFCYTILIVLKRVYALLTEILRRSSDISPSTNMSIEQDKENSQYTHKKTE